TVAYAGASLRDLTSVSVGALLRVRAVLAPSGGVLTASAVEAIDGFGGAPGESPTGSGKDGNKLEIDGVVSGRTAGSARFVVAGVTVDASGAVFSDGSLAALANGDRVQVGGAVKSGVLVATEVEVKADDDVAAQEFELRGNITRFVSTASFVVRGVTVDASGSSVKFSDGTAASLKLGVYVEIKGLLGSDGGTLVATEVKFDK
uniref:DUF5666 domain-containing protein n=1 Tax=Derxia lacustris TaxID=764842 RepID=UPI001F2DCD10